MAFLGQDGFPYGIGVVEDRFDPKQLGRVRVRWLGLMDEDKSKILTKDLPWCQVIQPATATSMVGIGHSSAIVEGTWVAGFCTDPELMQNWIVLGTLPGDNTRTAYRGGKVTGDAIPNSLFGAIPHARAWNKSRGDYKEFMESFSTETPGSAKKYKDYEKGFYDPTVDQRNIPHPPSDASYGNPGSGGGHVFTPTVEPPLVVPDDIDKGIPRVLNWADIGGGDHPSIQDLDKVDKEIWPPVSDKPQIPWARLTHTDYLHYMFKTTRRLTCDKRWKIPWIDFGTFRWPDTFTYTVDGEDKEPEGIVEDRSRLNENAEIGREGHIISTGFLEPKYWSEDREYGSIGGTWGPAFPITRDKPAYSTDPGGLTGIAPEDTRAGWGQASGEETGYWAIEGEDYRVPHPRVRWVRKVHLSPTERQTVMELFNAGYYGSGVYNISDPDAGRQDIHWNNVKEEDLVVVPQPDTNPLALGGIPISFTDGVLVETKSSLWADGTTYFSDPDISKGEPAKPLLQKGDIVQIAGVRGMQEVNGRIFRLIDCADNGTSFSMMLSTVDGKVWSGPGNIEWEHIDNSIGEFGMEGAAVDNADFSPYLGGGVVIPHNPHWSLCWKADMRERQINIGSPHPETGYEAMHWNQPTGDFNARYPFNHVYETESGHVMEYDDTPGAERISQFHRSGTNYEIDHSGTKTEYVKGDNYDIRLHDDYMYVKGKVVHTFDDEVMIRYNDRADISAKWKLQLWSGGDLDIHSKRNINMKSDGDINLQADGHINLHGTGVTAAQTDEYRAGTRNGGERSKIKMKAGHVEIEAVGNETKPKEYGVFIQSDQGSIGIKTLSDDALGNIHIAASHDIDLFAWNNQYRTAAGLQVVDGVQEGFIQDNSLNDYMIASELGDIHITSVAAEVIATAKTQFNIYTCAGDTVIWASGNTHTGGVMPNTANVAWKAFIPDTMELLSIDLPNPRPAVGTSVSTLALNANDVGKGIGGENIRNLHDDIANMQLGLSAYVTKTYPHTGGLKTYETDQSAYVSTGASTHTLEDPWNGYTGEPKKTKPLGEVGPERYEQEDPAC